MPAVRKWDNDHINKSLKQINSTTWLLGSYTLQRLPYPSETATWNDEFDKSSYVLLRTHTAQSRTTSEPDSPHVRLVHEAGDASVVWAIGRDAFCKIKYIEDGVTPESVTLNWVQNRRSSFDTPRVLCHVHDKDRSYLFLQRLPGRTLDKAWPSLTEQWRSFYVNAIVDICEEMASWSGHQLGGVDGQRVPEYYLQSDRNESNDALQATCQEIGIDCSSFVFFHADLGPANIIVEDCPKSGRVGIIDFEIAGYFPPGWIRTKFRVSPAMDLTSAPNTIPTDWRSKIQKALELKGYVDHSEGYMKWIGEL
jgi:aminoglycoside phosphotransferase